MTTQEITLTTEWTNITAVANLTVDSIYVLTNGTSDTLYWYESTSPPSNNTRGPALHAAIEHINFRQEAENLYMRVSDATGKGTVFVDAGY